MLKTKYDPFDDNMSKEEFAAKMAEFFNWTNDQDRPLYSWLESLKNWSQQQVYLIWRKTI